MLNAPKLSIPEPQDGVKISLDAAQITFIAADKLVLSLRGGELYVLTLCADSLRCVRSFHFSKAAASVLTCCVSLRDISYLPTGVLTFKYYFRCAFAWRITYSLDLVSGTHCSFDSPKKIKTLSLRLMTPTIRKRRKVCFWY